MSWMPGLREPVRFAEKTADDLELAHVRRIGVDHRTHVVERMDAERDRGGKRVPALLGAAVKLVHAPARVQRDAQAVLAFDHQPMEAGGVDSGERIARRDLARRDVGRGIDREVQRDRQLGQVHLVALEHDLLPGRVLHDLAGNVILTALAKGGRQVCRLHAEAGRKQLAIAGDVRDHRHGVSLDVLVDDHRTLAGALELEHERGDVEMGADGFADAQQLLREIAFHHGEETTQALPRNARLPGVKTHYSSATRFLPCVGQ